MSGQVRGCPRSRHLFRAWLRGGCRRRSLHGRPRGHGRCHGHLLPRRPERRLGHLLLDNLHRLRTSLGVVALDGSRRAAAGGCGRHGRRAVMGLAHLEQVISADAHDVIDLVDLGSRPIRRRGLLRYCPIRRCATGRCRARHARRVQ